MKRLLLFLSAIVLAAPSFAAPPAHHHYGWVSNPHHARGLTQFVHHPKFSLAPTPDVLDLSGCMPDSGTVSAPLAVHMPAIYDQGQEGSCTANAGTAAMEFIWHKTLGTFITGSRQGLYSCELTHDGNWPNDSGSYTGTVVWVLQNQGQGGEQLFPYNTPLSTPLPDFYVSDAATHKAVHGYDVDSTDHVSIQTAIAAGLPVLFGGYVYESLEELNAQSYFNAPNNGSPIGGHERLIVGYNRTLTHTYPNGTVVTGFYWVRNSWGTGWGRQGYCWEPMSEIENPQINEDFAVIDVVAVPAAQKPEARGRKPEAGGQKPEAMRMLKTDWDGLDIARRTEPERPEVWAVK